jgi:hypothetical protein
MNDIYASAYLNPTHIVGGQVEVSDNILGAIIYKGIPPSILTVQQLVNWDLLVRKLVREILVSIFL